MMVVPWGAGAWGGPPEAAIAAAGWQARFWAVVRLLLAAGLGCGVAVGVVDVGSTPTALSIFRIDQRTANSARLAESAAMDKFHVLAMPTTTMKTASKRLIPWPTLARFSATRRFETPFVDFLSEPIAKNRR